MKKYRVIKRAKDFAVQVNDPACPWFSKKANRYVPHWTTLFTRRWHWLASLELWWLRERARP